MFCERPPFWIRWRPGSPEPIERISFNRRDLFAAVLGKPTVKNISKQRGIVGTNGLRWWNPRTRSRGPLSARKPAGIDAEDAQDFRCEPILQRSASELDTLQHRGVNADLVCHVSAAALPYGAFSPEALPDFYFPLWQWLLSRHRNITAETARKRKFLQASMDRALLYVAMPVSTDQRQFARTLANLELTRRGWSLRNLARAADIAYGTARNVVGGSNPSAAIRARIETILGPIWSAAGDRGRAVLLRYHAAALGQLLRPTRKTKS